MNRYRVVWVRVVGVLTAAGGCLALLVVPIDVLVFSFAMLGLVVGATTWAWGEGRGWRNALWRGLAAAGVLLAAVTYVRLLGGWGLALVALLAATAPPVVRRVGRWCKGADPVEWAPPLSTHASRQETAGRWAAEQEVTRQPWMDGSPPDLEPIALCRAWRQSYLALGQPLSPQCKAGVVQRRRELLDELERRNPAGFVAWFASGAEAAEDPRRFIVTQRGDQSHL